MGNKRLINKKILLLTILLLISFFSIGGVFVKQQNDSVTLSWDANTEEDMIEYRLYQSQIKNNYTFGDGYQIDTIPFGTETATISGLSDGKYFFVLTAVGTAAQTKYEFEDDPGILVDSEEDSYDLIDGGSITNSSGQIGEAAVFDGTADYLYRIGASSDFWWNYSNRCTICTWIYADTSIDSMVYFSKGSTINSDLDLALGITADGSPFVEIGYNAGDNAETVYFTGANIEDDKWYHICIAVNDNGAVDEGLTDKEIRIRIWDVTASALLNGAEETPTYTNNWEPGQGGQINIGARPNPSDYWHGMLDDLRVYTDVLSSTEMDTVRNNGIIKSESEQSNEVTTLIERNNMIL